MSSVTVTCTMLRCSMEGWSVSMYRPFYAMILLQSSWILTACHKSLLWKRHKVYHCSVSQWIWDGVWHQGCIWHPLRLLDTEIPGWSKINPLPLHDSILTVLWDLQLYIIVLQDLWHYIIIPQKLWLIPKTSDYILILIIPFYFSCTPFPIYCTISVFIKELIS